ncbi:hypothetical protein [Cognatiluteimonas weifangensis]|uniref:hypothetical protein n=1 Tax=Cognatiluteimonas weifangensis TaxID=2303539 RepID=UPI0011C0E5F8|nr:hypothetical protein [Luteimonas weifangensis]
MLLLRANLEASEANPRFAAGTKLAALLFIAAPDLDAAEERASSELGGKGWSRMETERSKEVTNYVQFEGREDVVGQAFRDAQASGFGFVLYPEPGT